MEENSNKTLKVHSVKTNAIFNGLYQILTFLTPLITTPYISRVLDPSYLGQYSYYAALVSIFTMVANYGFNDYGTKKIAEVRDDVKKKSIVFFNIMLTKGLLSFMCIAIYIPFCFLYSNDETSLFMMLIMLGNIIAILIDPVFLFQGEENFISIAIRNSIIKILTVICFFIFVKSNQDILIYTFIMSISYVLSSSIIYFSFRKNSFVKINKIDLHPVFYLKEAFPYFIPALATSLYTNLNSVLLGAIGNDNTQNGYYSQAMKFINLLTALINSLSIVLLARVSYLTKRGDEEQIKQKTKLSFECFFALALPCSLGMASINSFLLPAFLTDKYLGSIDVLYLLCPVVVFSPLNSLLGNIYYRPNNKIWTHTIVMLSSSILNILLNLLLIGYFNLGAIGCGIATLTTEFIQIPFLLFFARNKLNLKEIFISAIKPLIASSLMFVTVFLTGYFVYTKINDWLLIFILLVIGISVYAIISIILKDKFTIYILNYIKSILSNITSKFKKKNNK